MKTLIEGAQRRREKPSPRPHRWRDFVTTTHRVARHAWELEEERVAIGYPTERKEFRAQNPGPTFKAALVGNAGLGPWS